MQEHDARSRGWTTRVSEEAPEPFRETPGGGEEAGGGATGGEPPGTRTSGQQGTGALTPAGSQARSRARVGREPDWRAVLAAASPREVLARLMGGDPLGLAAVVEERLRARAYLFDADRVFLRTAARCARLAVRYRGDPPIARWLAERADEALLDLLRTDAESDLRGEPPPPERLAAFQVLARPLGLDPARMHRACLAHNQLPQEQRRAFRELLIEGRSLDELAANGGRSATDIARAARAALLVVLAVVDDGGAP